MVVIVIQNHCNGEYPEEVITMFDYDFPSEYYWEGSRESVEMFNECDMEWVEDAIGCAIPKAVCLGVGAIADHGAGDGAGVEFWVVRLDKGKG
jgi:hypothetical protein